MGLELCKNILLNGRLVQVMIDFEEELKKFQPSLEVEQVEDAIFKGNSVDITELLCELTKRNRKEN